MRILIYEGDSFLGSHIADRFQKEGHDVTCIYTHDKGLGTYPSVTHAKYRYSGNLQQIEQIVKNERPHIIVMGRENPVTTIAQLQAFTGVMTQMVDASVKYHVSKFIYLSNISVYGTEKELFTEEDVPAPETIDAKCHTIAEECALKWRYEDKYSTVILRTSDVYGQRQDLNNHHIVWKMMKQAVDNRLEEGLNHYYSVLYSGDVVDAIYKSIGDFVDGIFNVTADDAISGSEIAEPISALFKITPPAQHLVTKKLVNADNTKAGKFLGFVNRVDIKKGVEHCYNWYKQNPTTKSDIKNTKIEKADRFWILRYIETLLFFCIAVLLTYSQTGWTSASSVSFLTLYIIVVGIFFGINHAVFAAMLVSMFNIYASMRNGMTLMSSLYDLNTMVLVVQNLIIGISIGYVVEQKNNIIAQKNETIESQASDLDYLNQLYDEMGEIKSELELRISEYDDSYGKINYTIQTLNSLAPEEIFVNSLNVIKELIHEENISLFIMDNSSMFLRRTAYIGEEPKLIPKTFRLKDYPKIDNIIRRKELYSNNFLDTDLPSMLVPIVYDGTVVSLIVIDKMHFDKLNLYYVNLMRIIASLINTAFYRAQEYEHLAIAGRYIKNTPILLPNEFEKEIALKNKMQETSHYQYSLLEIKAVSEEDEVDKAFLVSKMIRNNDDIGKTFDGKLCLLLSATSEDDAAYVIGRLSEGGVESELLQRSTIKK